MTDPPPAATPDDGAPATRHAHVAVLLASVGLIAVCANVLAADYLGSLVGSVAFPLVLLVVFGLVKTSFLVGLLNVVVALITILVFRRHLRHPLLLSGAALALAAVLVGAAFGSRSIASRFEHRLYRAPIETTLQSPYQRIVLTRGSVADHAQPAPPRDRPPTRRRNPFLDGEGDDLRLFLDGDLQFSSVDEYRYHEALVHPGMSALVAERSEVDVLILGGGDGLAVREALRYPETRSVTLVDLDSAVVELARRHPGLSQLNEGSLSAPRVRVEYADAFSWLARSKVLFHFIVADLPDPDAPALSKLYSVAFYRIVRRHLQPGGLFVSQSTSPYFLPRTFSCIHATLRATGMEVAPYVAYVPSFGPWGFNLAGPRTIDPSDLKLRVEELSFLTDGVLRGLFALPGDVEVVDVEANTLDRPVIVGYYYGDEQRER